MTGNEKHPDLSLSRRGFLKVGAAGAASWPLEKRLLGREVSAVSPVSERRSVIMICNVGGPSQLDTWDPKPHAESDVRGPFQAIRTTVPGVFLSELFPRHAKIAQHLALLRSCFHTSPAVHHVGWQCMQTGREFTQQLITPHAGCLAGYLLGHRSNMPPHVVLPALLRTTSRLQPTGQTAGLLGPAYNPRSLQPSLHAQPWRKDVSEVDRQLGAALDLSREPAATRQSYGATHLGQSCLAARRLVEAGVRCVTVNTCSDLQGEETWDVHGRAPYQTVQQLRERVAPAYDQAVARLIEDLHERGRLADTLVCCLSEFGRTPRMNPHGGRDHWPQCFTTYFAGGGVQGGRVVGRSDKIASEPVDRPVQPSEIVASIYFSLGLDPCANWLDPKGIVRPLAPAGAHPIWELF